MQLPKKIVETVEVKSVQVHCKISDSGSYSLLDSKRNIIADIDDYVPSFFPGEHYGDYLILDIDLETGTILNWKKPTEEQVSVAFNLINSDE